MSVQKVDAKKKTPPPKEKEHATVPVRLTPSTYEYVKANGKFGETVDGTIRRLLRIKDGTSENGGRS